VKVFFEMMPDGYGFFRSSDIEVAHENAQRHTDNLLVTVVERP
jgi:hypothetical protein